MEIAAGIEHLLKEVSVQIQIAGSLRRRKPAVNDIEILLIPKREVIADPVEMFPEPTDLALKRIDELIAQGTLEKRRKVNGTVTYGSKTKLLIHRESNMPVDIFACEPDAWINCLFSRTGGKTTNIAVASGAKSRGLAWKAFDAGFLTRDGRLLKMRSEEEIFRTAGLAYLPPHKRD